jgi:transposase InsO family protein
VTQQARQLSWQIQDGALPVRFLIHDRDSKFPAAFDTVFTAEEVTIIRTPVQAPNANAFAERWIRSVREECLDKLLILGERHLHRVLTTYVDDYNRARPHQGIEQQLPVPLGRSMSRDGPIERCDILGGVLHDYYRRAA